MLKQKLSQVLSFNGISIIIGIVGSVLGLFSIFVTDWNTPITLKWFVFTTFLSAMIILILLSLVLELLKEIKIKQPNQAYVVRYIEDSNRMLVEKNNFLGQSAIVTFFYLDDDYEVVLGSGYVSNIQDKFVTIELTEIDDDFARKYKTVIDKIENNDYRVLQKIFVKSYAIYKG